VRGGGRGRSDRGDRPSERGGGAAAAAVQRRRKTIIIGIETTA
jgi:hypothetical protein